MSILSKYRDNLVLDFNYSNGLIDEQTGNATGTVIANEPAFVNDKRKGIYMRGKTENDYFGYTGFDNSKLDQTGTFFGIITPNNSGDASFEGLMTSDSGGSQNWIVRFSTDIISLRVAAGTAQNIDGVTPLENGVTYIYIITVDIPNSVVKIWLNGKLDTEETTINFTSLYNSFPTIPIRVGWYSGAGANAYYNGIIHRTGALDVALTEQEVVQFQRELLDSKAFLRPSINRLYKPEDNTSYGSYIADGRGWNETLVGVTDGGLSNTGFYLNSGEFKVEEDECAKKKVTTISNGDFYFPSKIAYGEWSFDLYWDGSNTNIYFINDANSYNNNGYSINIPLTGMVSLYQNSTIGNTPLFSTIAGYLSFSTNYRFKITRDISTETFSVYIDDVLAVVNSGSNPVIDTTYDTSEFAVVQLSTGDEFKNISFIEEVYL